MSKPSAIPTCNCRIHKKVCVPKSACYCDGKDFERTEIVYSIVDDGYVCLYCRHYPLWTPADRVGLDDWRSEFSQDLNWYLENWNLEEESELEKYWREA